MAAMGWASGAPGGEGPATAAGRRPHAAPTAAQLIDLPSPRCADHLKYYKLASQAAPAALTSGSERARPAAASNRLQQALFTARR